MSKNGIMGGTFNPIHFGHLMLAECARDETGLDEVWFIPTGCPYLKGSAAKGADRTSQPTAEDRLRMTELAIRDAAAFQCSDIEVRRPGNTYSYVTLETLRERYPMHTFYFILGADCLFTIDTWQEPARLFAACKVLAAVRGDADLDAMREKIEELHRRFSADIVLLPFRKLELSSTDIRKRVSCGRSIRFMTPDPVIGYIEEKRFYQNENA